MHPLLPGPHIPPSALDKYNAAYDNPTYRAFRDALQSVAAATPAYDGEFVGVALNLLIDACLSRSGALFYQQTESSLMQLIRPLSPALMSACQAHLAKFGPPPEDCLLMEQDTAQQLLVEAKARADRACRASGNIHAWRGRVA